jgi:mannonate dehydratase
MHEDRVSTNMKRRNFFQLAAAGAAAATRPAPAAAATSARRVLFHAGTQQGHSPDVLRSMAAFGVKHICSGEISSRLDEKWSADSLSRFREQVESFGLTLAMIPLPMPSVTINKTSYPNILLGKSPERDREIDEISSMLRNAGKAGIPAVKYNLTYLGVVRSGFTPGRGGTRSSTFVFDTAKVDPQVFEMVKADDDAMWERIEYFLKRVVPVAEETKVRIACHPNDPGMPKGGFHGVPSVLSSVEGLKKFVSIAPSPYHGLNFCQGTVCEMLDDPAKEIPDVIRYFGSRHKIFNVHFRNIVGHRLNFREAFPDEGDINFLECARVYREVGYDGMLMPDHAPQIEGDKSGLAFAFEIGYIQSIIQTVRNEA